MNDFQLNLSHLGISIIFEFLCFLVTPFVELKHFIAIGVVDSELKDVDD